MGLLLASTPWPSQWPSQRAWPTYFLGFYCHLLPLLSFEIQKKDIANTLQILHIWQIFFPHTISVVTQCAYTWPRRGHEEHIQFTSFLFQQQISPDGHSDFPLMTAEISIQTSSTMKFWQDFERPPGEWLVHLIVQLGKQITKTNSDTLTNTNTSNTNIWWLLPHVFTS